MVLLKEFALYCPRPLSENREEMEVEARSRSIMSGITEYLKPRIKTSNFWKIAINLNGKNQLQHMKVSGGGVFYYNARFDIEMFLEKPIAEQKDMLVDFIEKTLNEIFENANLDKKKLMGLREFLEKRNYANVFLGPSSRNNGLNAYVLCKQKFEEAEIFIVLKKGNKEIECYPLLVTSPEEFVFNVYMNKLEWLSENEIRLEASNGEVYVVNRPKNENKGQKVRGAR